MDQEVAKTLGELELKLQELEHELTSLGHRDTPRHRDNPPHGQADTPGRLIDEAQSQSDARGGLIDEAQGQPNAPGKLIDEAVEREREQKSDAQERTAEEAVGDGFGGPAVWGGEEVPAQAGGTVERDWTVEVRETAYGEIPIPPPQAPDVSQAPWPPAPASHLPPHVPASPQAHPFPHVPAPPHTEPVAHHPYASTPTERQPVEVADLVEFKEKMQRTLDALIDEYSRLLSPKPPA